MGVGKRFRKTSCLIIFFIFTLVLHGFLISSCEDGQIDINVASIEKLDEIYGIGPVKAEAIVDYRDSQGQFKNLDELINVKGIGEATLDKIKSEGLACVVETKNEENNSNEQTNDVEKEQENKDDKKEEPIIGKNSNSGVENEETTRKKSEKFDTIMLNPKDIKSERSFSGEGDSYAIYGFVAFSILIGILFLMQKNRYKNEFG